jgi:hypothetical protein
MSSTASWHRQPKFFLSSVACSVNLLRIAVRGAEALGNSNRIPSLVLIQLRYRLLSATTQIGKEFVPDFPIVFGPHVGGAKRPRAAQPEDRSSHLFNCFRVPYEFALVRTTPYGVA